MSLSLLFTIILFILLVVLTKQRPIGLKHKDSGLKKTARLGWSWTYFCFGFFVPTVRGEIGVALLHFCLSLITLGVFHIIMSFLYNRQHATRLLTSGWVLDPNGPNFELACKQLDIQP